MIKRLLKVVGLRIEELILVGIIILNVLDFLEILPGDLDYTKKIISWSALGYLLYNASLTNIFFGKTHRKMDGMLILTYFTLIFKNFITFSAASIEDAPANLSFFYRFLIHNAQTIEEFSFYIGGILLFVLAMYAAYRYDILTPSLMNVIQEDGPRPKTVSKFSIRFVIILLVFVFFFVAVFNLMMEWLAFAVDAPILMFGIFFYLFKAKDFGSETLIFKLGNIGESFYEQFINLFHSKKSIFLGISGMLVLHLLTDVGNFVIPHILGIHDHLYFATLGPHHSPLPVLMLSDLSMLSSGVEKVALFLNYTFNSVGIVMLLCAPAFLWYALFRNEPVSIPNSLLGLFATGVTAFLISPAFRIGKIAGDALVGVDITTASVLSSSVPIVTATLSAIGVGFFVYLMCHNKVLKKMYLFASIIVSLAFFGVYTYFFFVDVSQYYIATISLLFEASKVFVGSILFLFFTTTIIFYAGGLLLFFYELVRN